MRIFASADEVETAVQTPRQGLCSQPSGRAPSSSPVSPLGSEARGSVEAAAGGAKTARTQKLLVSVVTRGNGEQGAFPALLLPSPAF